MGKKVCIVAPSGSGKSTSLGKIPQIGHEGLNPEETFIVSVSMRDLPFKATGYSVVEDPRSPAKGNFLKSDSPREIIRACKYVVQHRKEIKHIVIDDFQYIMGFHYMKNGLEGGYDVFKEIGKHVNDLFAALRRFDGNLFVLTHLEETQHNYGMTYKIKTVGKMVDQYLTLEGLFDVILFMTQTFDAKSMKSEKFFVTNFNGQFPAKSPIGMFDEITIKNDCALIVEAIKNYETV